MKTALVTGASRGIGRAVALRLAQDGYRVIAHYAANEAAMRDTLATLAPRSGRPHLTLRADLADPAAVAVLAHNAQTALAGEPLHALIHNAGIYEPSPLDAGADAWSLAWRRQMQVNCLAGVDLTQALLPHLAASGHGKVVQIASRAGERGEAGFSAYGASKAAQINFVKSLALETAARGVYAYAVAPGWTETDMAGEALRERGSEIAASIPFGRVAQPDEVASLVAFLCTEAADYLTGGTFDVNGASYLR